MIWGQDVKIGWINSNNEKVFWHSSLHGTSSFISWMEQKHCRDSIILVYI